MRNSTLVGALKNNPQHQIRTQLIRWLVLGWDNPIITPLEALNCDSYRSLMANWYIDRHNNNTRFDFFIKSKNKGTYIEVKNVTLSRYKNLFKSQYAGWNFKLDSSRYRY